MASNSYTNMKKLEPQGKNILFQMFTDLDKSPDIYKPSEFCFSLIKNELVDCFQNNIIFI